MTEPAQLHRQQQRRQQQQQWQRDGHRHTSNHQGNDDMMPSAAAAAVAGSRQGMGFAAFSCCVHTCCQWYAVQKLCDKLCLLRCTEVMQQQGQQLRLLLGQVLAQRCVDLLNLAHQCSA